MKSSSYERPRSTLVRSSSITQMVLWIQLLVQKRSCESSFRGTREVIGDGRYLSYHHLVQSI